MRRLRQILWGAVFAALLSTLAIVLYQRAEPLLSELPLAAPIGGPFDLVTQDGGRLGSETLKGTPFAVFFGFTYCPDVCPTTMLGLSNLLKTLGADADRMRYFFISVDTERDTPELLKGYVPNFGPTFIGLTGTPQQVADVARAYRVYYQKVPGKDGGPYLMDHSSIVYLLDRNGRFVTHFTHDAKAEQIANTVGRLL